MTTHAGSDDYDKGNDDDANDDAASTPDPDLNA